MKLVIDKLEIFATICAGLSLRAIVSLHSYSGAAKPPMFGDYEAQRHWQEVTFNLEPRTWYTNSSNNDLLYWGLDYPPLTAYHSYLIGTVSSYLNESYVKLRSSRGLESSDHKSFMRLTVLVADILIYIPGIVYLSLAISTIFQKCILLPFIMVALIYPGQILVDNGHFQYNNISLGLAAFAIGALLRSRHCLATLLFSLALNYKQMELYHALPIFMFLLRACLTRNSYRQGLQKFANIAITAILVFILLWLPWICSFKSILTVINRLFPVGRGVFEDIVANFWCTANVVYKLKTNFTNTKMAMLCFGTTLAFVLPINFGLIIRYRKNDFLYSLTNTAMAFFLFSFQVHEKSILLVAVPSFCMFILHSFETFWFLEITVFSMFPLFIKDDLVISYFCLMFIFHIITNEICIMQSNYPLDFSTTKINFFFRISNCFIIFLSVAAMVAPTPFKYPYLWSLLIAIFSCGSYILFFINGLLLQFINQ